MKDKQFENIYKDLDEIMDTIDEQFIKWEYDWEIAVDGEGKEEIEEKYKMPYWRVLSGNDDYNPEEKVDN